MSISFVAALAGTVLAAAGTGLAIRLCVRQPRTDMVAWVIALAGLTVALAAQAAGYRRGFVPTTFRATQLGGALVAPLALAWGMTELAARGLAARFAGRLVLAALFVVAGVILATDVLSSQPFGQAWPAARNHFEPLSLGLLGLVAVVVVVTILAALLSTGLRSRRDPAWRPALAAVALAGVAALATQGLQAGLPADAAYPALTAVAAVATWVAAGRAAGVSLGRMRGGTGGHGGPPDRGGDPGLRGRRLAGPVPRWLPPVRGQRGVRRLRQQRVRRDRGAPEPDLRDSRAPLRRPVRGHRRLSGHREFPPGRARGRSRRPRRAGHRGFRPALPAERVRGSRA